MMAQQFRNRSVGTLGALVGVALIAVALGALISSASVKLVALVCLGAVVAVVGLASPFAGLALLVCAIPVEEGFIIGQDLTALKIFGVVVLAGWAARWLIGGRRILFPRPLSLGVVVFILWPLVTTLWAGSLSEAFSRWGSLVLLLGFAFLIVQLTTSLRRLQILLGANLLGALIAAGLAFHNYASAGGALASVRTSAFTSGQGTAAYQNPDNFPILLALGACVCLLGAIRDRGWRQLLWLAAEVVLVSAALLSGTRSFIAAFGAALVLLLVLLGRARARRATVLLVALVVGAGIAAAVFLPGWLSQRFASTPYALFEQNDLGSGRVDYWKVYALMIEHHPLGGVGIGNGPVSYPQYLERAVQQGISISSYSAFHWGDAVGRDPHSDYLDVWAELGVIGIAVYMAFVVSTVNDVRGAMRLVKSGTPLWEAGLIVAMYLTVVLVNGLVGTTTNMKMYWLGIGLALSLPQVVRIELAKKSDPSLEVLATGRPVERSLIRGA